MLFVELRFFVFFAVVFGVYWATRSQTLRKIWLLVASYVFYAGWDWRFLSLLVISTFVDYFAAIGIDDAKSVARRRLWLGASLIANLGMLGFFKYFNFFAASFVDFSQILGLPLPSWTTLNIVLPVGISFFTFQTMSYSIDVYRGELNARKSMLDVALFVAFFPQLVAGPIVRARDYLPQSDTPRYFKDVDVRWCVMLFMVGFMKKACIADNVAVYVDAYYGNPGIYAMGASWLAAALWLTQIYCDFSGYSDMAIGCAALLGYRFPRNFDFPYLATDITAFWRRWHISMSGWFRDYIFFPIGGSRGSLLMTIRNILVTMFISGLWHGASWNFPIWGLVLGLGSVVVLLYSVIRKRFAIPVMPGVLGCALTLAFLLVSITLFRLTDFSKWFIVMQQMLLNQATGPETFGMQPFYLIAVLFFLHYGTYRKWFHHWWRRPPELAFTFLMGAWMAVMIKLLPMGHTPFIYFQF